MCCECIIGIITIVVTIFGFGITIWTILKQNRTKQLDNLIQLKNYITQFDQINSNLLPNGVWSIDGFDIDNIDNEEFSKLNSYIGFFEICSLMISEKQISKNDFKIFFHYRLQNLISNNSIKSYLRGNHGDWNVLIELINQYPNLSEIYNSNQ